MRVLMISTDKEIFRNGSEARQRILNYGQLFDELRVIVIANKETCCRSQKMNYGVAKPACVNYGVAKEKGVYLYPIIGSRILGIKRALKLAKKIFKAEGRSNWVVTTQDPFELGLIGYRLKKKWGVGWQAQVHTDWFSKDFRKESWKNRLRVLIAGVIIKKADSIRVVSERIKKGIVSKYKIEDKKITVLPIRVETDKLDSRSASWRTRNDKMARKESNIFSILMVSRLTQEKNIGLALEVVRGLYTKNKEIELIIVGDGPERKRLEVEVEKLELKEVVKFTGWKDNIEEYWQRADLFLLTSNYEGYGRVVVEAMSRAVPVVMTEVGVAGEIIKDKENGLVIPTHNRILLEEAISNLKRDKKLRDRLGEAGRKTAKNFISQAEYLKQYKKLVEEAKSLRVLMITQKVDRNDDVLGIYHEWIREIGEKVDELNVICLFKGEVNLPKEIGVYSLEKEKGESKLKYIFKLAIYLWQLRSKYDRVFVHMNEEYLILAGWWWKLTGKRVVFWRNHPRGGMLTRIAVGWSQVVLCTSPKAWVARFKKAKLMPVGVEINKIINKKRKKSSVLKILYIGRIAMIKRVDVLIRAGKFLKKQGIKFEIGLVGEADKKDYLDKIKKIIKELKLTEEVKLLGSVPNRELAKIYDQYEILINLTETGSLDKVMFEAMAKGLLVVTSNKVLKEWWPKSTWELLGTTAKPEMVAKAINRANKLDEQRADMIRLDLQKWIVKEHSIERVVEEIVKVLN